MVTLNATTDKYKKKLGILNKSREYSASIKSTETNLNYYIMTTQKEVNSILCCGVYVIEMHSRNIHFLLCYSNLLSTQACFSTFIVALYSS